MFLKFGCGCVGLPADADGRAIIIKPCDGDAETGFFYRTLNPENLPGEPIPAVTEGNVVTELGRLASLGHRFQELQALLDIPRR